MSPAELTGDPVGFIADERVIASWPLALKVGQGLAARHADRVLAEVAREEREYQRNVIHGRRFTGRRGREDSYVEPEIIRDLDEEHYAPKRALLRQWCGDVAVARWDELAELRKEVRRVGDIAERAIAALRSARQLPVADRLEHELGQAVEMLRAEATED